MRNRRLPPADDDRSRIKESILYLILVMSFVSLSAMVIVAVTCFRLNLDNLREMLRMSAIDHARLIEIYAGGDETVDIHGENELFGKTGEIIRARREGDSIVVVRRSGGNGALQTVSIAFESPFAEPTKRALAGESGTLIGHDYRGEKVLAAYRPVSATDSALVAKIDLSEIRAPFVNAVLLAVVVGTIILLLGALIFLAIGGSILDRLEIYSFGFRRETEERKRVEVEQNRLLRSADRRAKELECMYGLAESIRTRETIEQILCDVVALIPPACGHPAAARVRIRFENSEFASRPFEETRWKVSSPLVVDDERIGSVDLFYLEKQADCGDELFLSRERELVDRVAGALSEAIESERAREALGRSEARLTSLYEAMIEGVCIHEIVTNGDGTAIDYRILDVNPAFERITGIPREKAIGALASRLYGSGEAPYLETYARVAETGVATSFDTVFDPMKKSFRVSAFSLGFGRFATVFEDTTDHENLQAQLRQAQRMEAVGRLAGGVAHDFNNMLGVILGHAEIALAQLRPVDPLYGDLLEIRKAAESSANLTRQLLAFARRQTIAPKVLDLNETVEGMLKMLRRLIGENVALVWIPGAEIRPVRLDPSQIDQVLANLCVNARDAIEDVGMITIETANVTFDSVYCDGHAGAVPGDYVMLAVSDDGIGMNKETLDRLFEPFFTTKKGDIGTGLGLATVYGIVKQNGGLINVYSEPGNGTTVKIYLPRHGDDAPGEEENGSGVNTEKGRETILLVEDELPVLKMTTMMLELQGYTVLAASGPAEAVRLAEECGRRIDLLITDVIMPEMNGKELAEKLAPLHPEMKQLFMSGYTANVIAHRGVLDEGVDFIEKPFTTQRLIASVQTALDATD